MEARPVKIQSTRVLLGERGPPRPAIVAFSPDRGVIVGIEAYGAHADVVDFGDMVIGPGLVDLGCTFLDADQDADDAFLRFHEHAVEGGVTTVVHTPVSPGRSVPSLGARRPRTHFLLFHSFGRDEEAHDAHVDGVLANVGLPSRGTWECDPMGRSAGGRTGPLYFLSVDAHSPLASPFRGKAAESRASDPGTVWRLGRDRRDSGESGRPAAEEDGVAVPPSMLHVLLTREQESFRGATTLESAEPDSRLTASSGRKRRPSPIQTQVPNEDPLLPKNFLKDYRVHLSLRPWETEVAGLIAAARLGAKAVLRVASAQALACAASRTPGSDSSSGGGGGGVRLGTTIAHLYYSANDVLGSQATWLKLDPPLRRWEDCVALRRRAMADDTFVVSSGHEYCPLEIDADFERAYPNGPCVRYSLRVLWSLAEKLALDTPGCAALDQFAVLWRRMSVSPAHLLGLHAKKGCLRVGADADIVVFNPSGESALRSASRSPFVRAALSGNVHKVFIRGQEATR